MRICDVRSARALLLQLHVPLPNMQGRGAWIIYDDERGIQAAPGF